VVIVRLPSAWRRRLKQIAKAQRAPLSSVVQLAVLRFLKSEVQRADGV
jgi:predicted transcriptional regulator